MPQLETCQECGAEVPRGELVRKRRAYGYDATFGGNNLLLYSSYNSDFWTCDTATDAGCVSIGLYADHFRPRISGSTNAVTEARGSQTWTASGLYRTNTSVDISGYTNVYFAIHVGAYHAQSTQTLTVAIGFCDSSGSTKYQMASFNVMGQKRCWFTSAVADLDAGITTSAAYLYADVTISGASSKWWADGAILCDRTTHPIWIPQTKGAAKSATGTGHKWRRPILCKECRPDRIVKPEENRGDPRNEDPVEIGEDTE